jgi:Domain of unknown function (DU1801)
MDNKRQSRIAGARPDSVSSAKAQRSAFMSMNNPAHGTADDVRATCSETLMPIFDILYRLIRSHAGQCLEISWPKQRITSFGVGPKKMSQHHCYIAVYANHINLGFYHGALLPDPNAVLEGTGKGLRHIKISSIAMASNLSIANLVRAAVLDREGYRNA